MALIKCPECGKEISDKAEICIGCGFPIKEYKSNFIEKNYKESESKKKFCPYCNSENIDKSNYCNSCGMKIIESNFVEKENKKIIEFVKKQNQDKKVKKAVTIMLLIGVLVIFIHAIFLNSNNEDTNNFITAEADFKENETVNNIEDEESYKTLCKEYDYKDVLRNPDQYKQSQVKVTLKISSIHEKNLLNSHKYYLAYTKNDYGWYGDLYCVFDSRVNSDLKLLEEDIIKVYGLILDPEYTSSFIVNSQEVFCIDMKYVDLISE